MSREKQALRRGDRKAVYSKTKGITPRYSLTEEEIKRAENTHSVAELQLRGESKTHSSRVWPPPDSQSFGGNHFSFFVRPAERATINKHLMSETNFCFSLPWIVTSFLILLFSAYWPVPPYKVSHLRGARDHGDNCLKGYLSLILVDNSQSN